jgi:tRNA threonylcarbamoyl adenosine modification protein (Sua5/YciO/YrdC/YwlC family)
MLLNIHPINPQPRLIHQAIDIIRKGGVIAYPTDCAYALACRLSDRNALQRLRTIRQLDTSHLLTLICRDLSEIATYAQVDNGTFRLLKANTPGPYTFLLKATKQVPKIVLHEKRKTIGIRIPNHAIIHALLDELDEPLLSTSLILPESRERLSDANEIKHHLGQQLDLIIDGGPCLLPPSTIVDLSTSPPVIVREGQGSIDPFQ